MHGSRLIRCSSNRVVKVSDSNTLKSSVPEKETSSANGEIDAHLQSDVDNDVELFEENDHQQLLSIFDHQQPTSPAVHQHISSVNQQQAASLANIQDGSLPIGRLL